MEDKQHGGKIKQFQPSYLNSESSEVQFQHNYTLELVWIKNKAGARAQFSVSCSFPLKYMFPREDKLK